MKNYTMTIHNMQGASDVIKVKSIRDARLMLDHKYADPQNLKAMITDSDASGTQIAYKPLGTKTFKSMLSPVKINQVS